MPRPVPQHAELADGERHKDADDVELDQSRDVSVECDDQDDREEGQHQDPVAVGQAVAAGVQLARQIAVPGQDRAKHREAVESGVRSQEQDQHRSGHDEVERRLEVGEYGLGQLADGRLLDDIHPLAVERVVGQALRRSA